MCIRHYGWNATTSGDISLITKLVNFVLCQAVVLSDLKLSSVEVMVMVWMGVRPVRQL